MRLRRGASITLALALASGVAWAGGPILHERIPADPAEDARLGVGIDGDLPAAIETPSGLVQAPDPRRTPSPAPRESPLTSSTVNAPPNATFVPDRVTSRPDVLPYEDPFTPSTAPFKRLLAYDAVNADYTLSVRDPRLVPLASHATATEGTDDVFFADLVVDLSPGRAARIPSVGPGSKIVRARAGVGSADVPVRFVHDGADNWFVQADTTSRARLVMEIAAPRAAFGGQMGDPSWSDLPKVPALPARVARAAAEVAARIGVSRAQSPREVTSRLVSYYRGFVDSDVQPTGRGDVYLDLALSKKGVCRHRAFAFLVTALGLGLPARMIANEAHAWVEVNDGSLWRRIDLGGAGRALDAPVQAGPKHDAPPDPFGWPPNAESGSDLAERARTSNASGSGNASANGNGNANGSANANGSGNGNANGSANANGSGNVTTASSSTTYDERPTSKIAVTVVDADPHRNSPLHVRGSVASDGASCGHVLVAFALKDGRGHEVALGALATNDDGAFEGALVVPASAALGDYDLIARTPGDARCGHGGAP